MTDLIDSEIDCFLAEKAQETAHRGRLIFALDMCGRLAKSGRVALSMSFRIQAARHRTALQPPL